LGLTQYDVQEVLKIEEELTEQIIGCLIEVHKELGPSLLESGKAIKPYLRVLRVSGAKSL
jgi:hypothetical protein